MINLLMCVMKKKIVLTVQMHFIITCYSTYISMCALSKEPQ